MNQISFHSCNQSTMEFELAIEKGMRLKEIQKRFNNAYPFLKLEFYNKPHPEKKLSPNSEKLNPEEKIRKINHSAGHHSIKIDSNRTVADLEQEFWNFFGLSAQVFRKSGNLWIETSLTDTWTLDKQNDIGESFKNNSSEG
jgi:hypothetical protein